MITQEWQYCSDSNNNNSVGYRRVNKDACGMQLEFIGKCLLVSSLFYQLIII